MIRMVLDSTVALQWATPLPAAPLSEPSLRLLRRYRDGELAFLVPEVFWSELGDQLSKGARCGRWRRQQAQTLAEDFLRRDFTTVSSTILLPDALRIALACDRTLPEGFYAALAVEAKAEWITADEAVANALAARFPVKWLGGF